ncbi:class II aldolase/adducin family protein [Phnomibacter ginsenosidimutans]|uniref:Class II aldolase/adducin family protein n=1 Tax=Phnomibacter ginsenosidimutans TaxID=2676868 RepID=A0A6I6H202_9BACT|nr:class II aldolase/adducin family protein [Phnomibacter ginsenosidimutans]QGW28641.1 class II aldolase/adducin family protein [Phnomibacter ginsenosidimutans]
MDNILNTSWQHPREQVAMVISRIYRRGLTTTSGGNISVIDEQGDIWVTPSGIDKGSLTIDDIVCVKADGSIIGRHKPSSEFPFHKAIYEARPDVKAIIHAHPPALVSFSIVRQIPNTNIILQARKVCGPIGYADYRLPGSAALGDVIAGEFKKGFSAVIMENHGTVVGGSDLADAFLRFETLEFSARTILYASMVGTPNFLTNEQINDFDEHLVQLPVMEKAEHPSDERAIRHQICNIVRRACTQGLMTSSYGTVSVRWRGNDFLITPTDVPRWDLQASDVVQVKDGCAEPGKVPSRSALMHQKIYATHPHINSIIHTQSTYLMAFASSKANFNVRTIPESWIFLQDVHKIPFGQQFGESEAIIGQLSKSCPALLIENDCILVTGDKLLQTFDYLEVAEFSAKSLVLAASLGEMVPISDEQVEDLRKAFIKE